MKEVLVLQQFDEKSEVEPTAWTVTLTTISVTLSTLSNHC
ncbi:MULTISPECIES: class III lanthipeptide [Bacillus subtilis group]|nr:class III lanthipeptide [Bacillus amyloliquefaciens]ARW37995.1 hypothetical protein S101267_00886 [Bacillus amyloliquefaciens]AZV92246.1 hypothetical protein BUN12_4004 [Bacillus amyloliquefaciens]MBW8280957.1 class III lanthipeptide [Bacillus amyloliquefaciens]OBR31597.1 hypothetical protein SRCM101266_00858 [Bacillus amyloliquefaciens]QOQ55807.1 class III lanthipeptide [Bacillus amyloliquefaciens]